MTCVVAKPGVLWTDSRESGTTKRNVHKAFSPHGTYWVGVAGECGPLGALENLVKWPKRPTVKNLTSMLHFSFECDARNYGEAEFLVCLKKSLIKGEGMYVYETDLAAIGSGASFALGYLRGKPSDLEGAVEAACYLDPYCAGPVIKYVPSSP